MYLVLDVLNCGVAYNRHFTQVCAAIEFASEYPNFFKDFALTTTEILQLLRWK
jgi:hypothetical protein